MLPRACQRATSPSGQATAHLNCNLGYGISSVLASNYAKFYIFIETAYED